MCLNFGTPMNINFPFGTNGKLMVLGVPILKYIRVPSKGQEVKWIEVFGDGAENGWLIFALGPACEWKTLPIHPVVNGYLFGITE